MDNQLKSWGIKNFSLENRAYSEKLEVKSSAWCGYERWQGIRVFSNKFSCGLSEEAAPLQITEISDSIEKLQLLYGYEFTKSKELLKLQPFDKVADSIEKEYSMLLTDNKYEAVAAQLAFWVKDVHDQEELDMEPVWVVTIRECKEDRSSDYIEYEEIYSAITAKNIG
ncbi:hypothetical protein [Mediterraneibacter agrestimuris]|uniref:hypothetical protein n=1 Tax=Mediterraneibacter agrestimuris TaxID=2941333 RepID=UPI00203F2BD6|nr:hypothetical protein [Mediterraneibacter agrestimuris]